MDNFDLGDAMTLGAGYALFRHGQDRQATQVIDALQELGDRLDHHDRETEAAGAPAVDHTQFITEKQPAAWDDYFGQEPLKRQLMVALNSAKIRNARFPHTLLASGLPGVGKTTMARLVAQAMDVDIVELVPPFKIETLVAKAAELGDGDILFIDEIHKLTDGVGARGAEMLLKVLEDGVAYLPSGEVVELADITIIGATTDRDKLPEPVIDRFKLKPYFQAYSPTELSLIAIDFTYKHDAENLLTRDVQRAAALACRGTPRIIEEMVLAARDLSLTHGRPATAEEMLEFLEVEPDGLTRTHIHYLTAMRQYFGREARDGDYEFIVGEAAMQQILRETKQGIGRVERFLVERGLIDRTPRGRRLTPAGIARAEAFIAAGKGVSDV